MDNAEAKVCSNIKRISKYNSLVLKSIVLCLIIDITV